MNLPRMVALWFQISVFAALFVPLSAFAGACPTLPLQHTGSKHAQATACLAIDTTCILEDAESRVPLYARDQCFFEIAKAWVDTTLCNFITLGDDTPEMRRACQIATRPVSTAPTPH
jgi:hypothetical protein